MRIAVMQPYLFPYIGYFQLINSVDKFVFYDDVNFIKNGWINRNKILINDNANYLTMPLIAASSNKLINEIKIVNKRRKLIKSISQAYKKAPFYNEIMPLIECCLLFDTDYISQIAQNSVETVANYIGLNVVFETSSKSYSNTRHLKKAERLIAICNINNASQYINAIGGMDLYSKEQFAKENIQLNFLKSLTYKYAQFKKPFVKNLSIIDILMFNSVGETKEFLDQYKLV
jgi:hypothetical protein